MNFARLEAVSAMVTWWFFIRKIHGGYLNPDLRIGSRSRRIGLRINPVNVKFVHSTDFFARRERIVVSCWSPLASSLTKPNRFLAGLGKVVAKQANERDRQPSFYSLTFLVSRYSPHTRVHRLCSPISTMDKHNKKQRIINNNSLCMKPTTSLFSRCIIGTVTLISCAD